MKASMKVDFGGCGQHGEWLTFNVDDQGLAHLPPDITADITAAAAELDSYLAEDSVDEARCVATFEHLPAHDLVPTLKYWRKFLKPGASLLIMVPDMRSLVWDWMNEAISTQTFMDCAFSPPEWTKKAPGELHRYGFDEEFLVNMLWEAGYSVVARDFTDHPDMVFYVGDYQVPNLVVVAWK